jgi:DNA-binding PucR family transcriptional regulator
LLNDVAFFLMFRHSPTAGRAGNERKINNRGARRMKRPREQTGAVSFLERIAEQRILEAQRNGAFDNLPGKGKPLELEDMSWVPDDLRIGYHVLKNANILPPEAELLKDIHTLEDLLKHVEDEGERLALAKSIQWKMIRLDMLKRRSLDQHLLRQYGRKLVNKFRPR